MKHTEHPAAPKGAHSRLGGVHNPPGSVPQPQANLGPQQKQQVGPTVPGATDFPSGMPGMPPSTPNTM